MQKIARNNGRSLFKQPKAISLLVVSLSFLSLLGFWSQNLAFNKRGYQATVFFSHAGGITPGTKVFYRGAEVGRVLKVDLQPQPEKVAVEIQIFSSEKLIPINSSVEVTQSNMSGETSVEIIPLEIIPSKTIAKPLDPNCNSQLIICHGSRLPGQEPMDMAEIIRSFESMSDFFNDPEAIPRVKAITQKTATSLEDLTDVLKKINQSEIINDLVQN
jgi:phospholipid/cholesterol/gamma-HCH transport system substrate-binding protein